MLSQTGSPVHLRSSAALVSRNSDSSHNSRAGHPGWLRCSSLTYSRYARSSRLAIRAPRSGTYATNHCYGTLGTAACYILYVAVPGQNAIEAISSGYSKYTVWPEPGTLALRDRADLAVLDVTDPKRSNASLEIAGTAARGHSAYAIVSSAPRKWSGSRRFCSSR